MSKADYFVQIDDGRAIVPVLRSNAYRYERGHRVTRAAKRMPMIIDDDAKFTTIINSAIDDGLDIDATVDIVIGTDQFQEHVRAMLRQRVANIARNRGRQAERRAEVAWRAGNVVTASKELVGQTFALPDGRFVEWHRATASEHRQRAQWQRNRAASLAQDARLHEVAAQVIEEAGVVCLGEIKSLTPWPELVNANALPIEAE